MGEIYSKENLSQTYQDALLCLEMPLFAWMHWYAFPWTDYEDTRLSSRLQVYYALRDCLGYQDIVYDTLEAFPNVLNPSAWFTFSPNRQPIFLDDDETEPIRGTNLRNPRRYGTDITPLEFKLDPNEEQEYQQARNLIFGDYHFPVIHDDWRHPPEVQVIINRNAAEFYENVSSTNGSREDLWSDLHDDETSDQARLIGPSSSSGKPSVPSRHHLPLPKKR